MGKGQAPAPTGVGSYLDQVITEEELARLAAAVPGPCSGLSPLKSLQARFSGAETPSGLAGAFVDGTGRLRPHAAAVLQTLAAARSFGSIGFAGRGLVFESATYFPGVDGAAGVSLSNRGDRLRIQSPPAAAAAAEMLGLQTGESLVGRIGVEAELSLGEGAVFFGCLDAVRRKELAGLLSGSVDGRYGVSHVEEALTAAEVGMQWLAPLYRDFTALPKLNGKCIRKALTALLEKGYIRKDQGGWKPSPPLRQAAAELLLVDAHARLRQAVIGADGTVTASDLRVIQGRSGAFLLWTTDQSSVSISGASGAQVSIMARDLMGLAAAPGRECPGNAGPPGQREVSAGNYYEERLALVQGEADSVGADGDTVVDTVGTVPGGTQYVKWPYRTGIAGDDVGGSGDDSRFDDLAAIGRSSLADLMRRTGAREVGDLAAKALKGKTASGFPASISEAGKSVLGRKQSGGSSGEDEEGARGGKGDRLFEETGEDNSYTWL